MPCFDASLLASLGPSVALISSSVIGNCVSSRDTPLFVLSFLMTANCFAVSSSGFTGLGSLVSDASVSPALVKPSVIGDPSAAISNAGLFVNDCCAFFCISTFCLYSSSRSLFNSVCLSAFFFLSLNSLTPVIPPLKTPPTNPPATPASIYSSIAS